MWNRSIKLPIGKTTVVDADGFGTDEITYMDSIPADFQDLSRNATILANQNGYNAVVSVEIMDCNYDNQKFLVDEASGTIYDVRRTFRKYKGNTISLDCEVREHGGI